MPCIDSILRSSVSAGLGVTALLGATLAAPALAQSAELVWESTEGFITPESVLYDSQRGVMYVSNVNGAPNEADGNGYISKILPSGEVADGSWVDGLDAPKGLAMHGGKLYVSDINQLVEIDIESGEITQRYQGADSKFLNDVTADAAGNVYVSDMVTNRIYRLSNGSFDVWVDSPDLDNPNGLHAEPGRLIVGAWGVMTDGFATAVPGHMKTVSLADGSIASLGDATPVGNLDGVEADGSGGYFVTDWMAGKLLRVDTAGNAEMLIDFEQGSADHEYIQGSGLVIVPLMMENKVVAYRVR